MAAVDCWIDSTEALREHTWCLLRVSKDLRGDYRLEEQESRSCAGPGCRSLVTTHTVRFEVAPGECDEVPELDGLLEAAPFCNVFEDANPFDRAVHSAEVRWAPSGGGAVVGTMTGLTNAGTHRPPAAVRCEECSSFAHLEGRLCATIDGVQRLGGCELVAVYCLSARPNGWNGRLEGTLEGVVVRPCEDR
jgi:hypothetical protein